MPRDPNGDYELPAGNPVVPGTVIASDWANPTIGDLGNEMSDSLSRMGKGGMQAPLRLINGAEDGPSLTFNQDILAGRYLFSPGDMRDTLQNEDRLRFTVDGVFVMIDGVWVPINPTLTGRKNFVINGNFDIWQRGTEFLVSTGGNYTADRFSLGQFIAGVIISQQPSPGDHTFLARLEAQGTGQFNYVHRIEGVKPLLGKTVTATVKLVCDVGITNAVLRVFDGNGGTGTLLQQPFTPTGSLQTVTLTGTLSVHDNPAQPWWQVSTIGDATIGQQMDFYEVQLEEGTHGTAFENTPIAETLALCQRYYEKSYDQSENPGTSTADGLVRSAGWLNAGVGITYQTTVSFKVTKRAVPTPTIYDRLGAPNLLSGIFATSATQDAVPGNVGPTNESSFRVHFDQEGFAGAAFHWTADAEL